MSTVKSTIIEMESRLAQLKQLEQQQAEKQAEIELQRQLLDEEFQEKLSRQQQLNEVTQRILAQVNELRQMKDLNAVAERLSNELNAANNQIAQRHYQIGQNIKHLRYLWADPVYEQTGKVGAELNAIIVNKLINLLDMPGYQVQSYLQ